jgi:hypothetical protein
VEVIAAVPGLVEGGVDKQNQIAELVYVPSQSVILAARATTTRRIRPHNRRGTRTAKRFGKAGPVARRLLRPEFRLAGRRDQRG